MQKITPMRGHSDEAQRRGVGGSQRLVRRVELLLDVLVVEVHRALGNAQDDGDFPGALAVGGPLQDLAFAMAQADRVGHQHRMLQVGQLLGQQLDHATQPQADFLALEAGDVLLVARHGKHAEQIVRRADRQGRADTEAPIASLVPEHPALVEQAVAPDHHFRGAQAVEDRRIHGPVVLHLVSLQPGLGIGAMDLGLRPGEGNRVAHAIGVVIEAQAPHFLFQDGEHALAVVDRLHLATQTVPPQQKASVIPHDGC